MQNRRISRFTPLGVITIGLLLGGAAIFLWFLFTLNEYHKTHQAHQPRAISAADHAACADMPRGDMPSEYRRQACFDSLYDDGAFIIVGDTDD